MNDQAIMQHYSSLVFENQEEGRVHNPYDQEIREQSSIERGDIQGLRQSIAEKYTGEVGTLSKDALRSEKNLSICVVAVSCRSAIRGGLAPELAFSLSDSYIREIDACRSVSEARQLLRSAQYKYTEMVHGLQGNPKRRNEKNPHIQRCRDYIFSHLHDKLEVREIAEALSLSPNYLSELFGRLEGTTLNQFIHQTKAELAKNMLVYSQYSYSEIAAYLGYSSQSHLGRQFKKVTGYTLDRYRRQFGVKNSGQQEILENG